MSERLWVGSGLDSLATAGVSRAQVFCVANGIKTPLITPLTPGQWRRDYCGLWTPKGIKVCPANCARVATERQVRNWNWPGSVTDRTPYGVVAHEMGHHADYMASPSGQFSWQLRRKSGEAPITSYCPNDQEWFAEMFRLFITNAALLAALRPRTYELLSVKWFEVSHKDWEKELGADVPDRIVANLHRRIKLGK